MSSPQREPDHDDEHAHDEVESSLHRPVPAREHGRPELEQRCALARHVLAALHEQLGRVGREPHLDALTMRLLDDLEHRPLVEVGLREDHLVGLDLVEHLGELGALPEKPEARNGLGRDDSHELVRQAAPGRLERRAQADEALAGADEDDAAADPRRAHHLERGGLVRGAQQPDRHAPTRRRTSG